MKSRALPIAAALRLLAGATLPLLAGGALPLFAGAVLLAALSLAGCWGSGDYPPLERQRIGYANHGSYFPIDDAAVHSRPDCQLCHGGTATFREFACTGCHEHAQARIDSLHARVAGYAYGPKTCYGCHPNGTAAGVDHAQFFPIGPGTAHSAQRCADCHNDPQDRHVFTCVSCHSHAQAHTDSTHLGVPGYQYLTSSCLTCHPDGAVMTPARHQPLFPIASGPHVLACADCHTTPRDFGKFECILCHSHSCDLMNPKHREVRNYSCVSGECYRCHPNGRSGD